MIRTLIVDDSPAYLAAMRQVLGEDHAFQVVGEAGDGDRALSLAVALKPQLVLMDVQLPGASGIEVTARLMREAPCAVVVMSGLVAPDRQRTAFEALQAGAVEVLAKPRDLGQAESRERLRTLLKAMAAVKVIRRRAGPETQAVALPRRSLVAIGSSTGGPPALRELLSALPRDLQASVLIAQHLAPGFAPGLVSWLANATSLRVKLVEAAEPREPGTVYLAADGRHLLLDGDQVRSLPASKEDRVAPSVDRLFASLEAVAPQVVAAVLTGMGADGSEGLLKLRSRGAYTLCQDEATSLIYGMPRVAHERGAAVEQLPLGELGPAIARLVAAARPRRELDAPSASRNNSSPGGST